MNITQVNDSFVSEGNFEFLVNSVNSQFFSRISKEILIVDSWVHKF